MSDHWDVCDHNLSLRLVVPLLLSHFANLGHIDIIQVLLLIITKII
jgi:hypothetical protein